MHLRTYNLVQITQIFLFRETNIPDLLTITFNKERTHDRISRP